MAKKRLNPFENPLGYSLARQDETLRLISEITCFIKDERVRKKAIRHIREHRDKIVNPLDFDGDHGSFFQGNMLHYCNYCKKLFSLAGLYSLEDDYVRLYVYVILGNREGLLNREVESGLEKALAGLFSDKYSRQFTKRLKKAHLGTRKDSQKAHAYLLYVSRGDKRSKSYRSIAKDVGIHHQTVRKYIEELEDMLPQERKDFLDANTPDLENPALQKYNIPKDFNERKMKNKSYQKDDYGQF